MSRRLAFRPVEAVAEAGEVTGEVTVVVTVAVTEEDIVADTIITGITVLTTGDHREVREIWAALPEIGELAEDTEIRTLREKRLVEDPSLKSPSFAFLSLLNPHKSKTMLHTIKLIQQ